MASPFTEATAGALGSAIASVIVFPLDVVKTRMQVQTDVIKEIQYKSALEGIYKIIESEGISGLYAGLESGILGTIVSSFSYYYIYSTVRIRYLRITRYHKSIKMAPISTAMELILGALAGALCQAVVLPIGIVTTRQQTSDTKKSVRNIIISIIKEDGVRNLWKGLQASLVLCINPAITFSVFERLKAFWIQKRNLKYLTTGQIFIIAALSKALATVITYPYIMAKVKMQWKAPKNLELSKEDREAIRYTGAWDILRKVYRANGIRGWYIGMQVQIMKAMLSQAIVFTIKDKVIFYTLLAFAKVRK